MQDYQTFENMIANLHRTFYPNASITWNKRIIGRSGVERQIDVFIEDYSGAYPMKIVVDCKLYASSKVDIKDVESTWMLVNDIRANLGIIICNSGYTEGAIKRAKDIGLLKLCLTTDSQHEKFSAKLAMPILAQKCELKYTVEVYPKALVPIMRKLGSEEIFLENTKTLEKNSLYEFILNYVEIDKHILSSENTVEILDREYYLYIKQKSRKYLKLIIKYAFVVKLVVSHLPIKEGKGVFEVLRKDKEYDVGSFLIGNEVNINLGSEVKTDYSTKELKNWIWRDFDPKKDFPVLLMTDFELIDTLLELEENFI
jgi:hypothetical protein